MNQFVKTKSCRKFWERCTLRFVWKRKNCLTAAELLLGDYSSEFLVITTGKRQTDREREGGGQERKSCCQNYLLTFCHGCQGVRRASRQTRQKLLSNMKRSWLVVCIHLSLSLYILFDHVGTTARLILLG